MRQGFSMLRIEIQRLAVMAERFAGVARDITEQAQPVEHLGMRRIMLQITRTRRLGFSAATGIGQAGNLRQ
ncbi:hypothetical protein D3C75_1145770 [compost metagenome]